VPVIAIVVAVASSVGSLIPLRLSAFVSRIVAIHTTILRRIRATSITVELVAFVLVQAPLFTVFGAPATPAFVISTPTGSRKKQQQREDLCHTCSSSAVVYFRM
jgi:hypothetical protein